MDGLAATKRVRALEAEFAQVHKDEAMGNMRIPIVGLSADIQQTTKEVGRDMWLVQRQPLTDHHFLTTLDFFFFCFFANCSRVSRLGWTST